MHGTIEPRLEAEHTVTLDGRSAPRITLMLRNAKLCIDGKEVLCIVRDVSVTGVRIRAFHSIPAGRACSIELWEGQRFPIEQAWNNGQEAGYAFSEAMDLEALIYENGPFPKRPLRVNLTLPATILHGDIGTQVTICNLSQQGVCVESDRRWPQRQRVRISGEGLPDPLDAIVLWNRGNQHGLVFEQTFALADFALLVAKLQFVPLREGTNQSGGSAQGATILRENPLLCH